MKALDAALSISAWRKTTYGAPVRDLPDQQAVRSWDAR